MNKVRIKTKGVSRKAVIGLWLSCLIVSVQAVFALAMLHPVNAATFTVNSTADAVDANPGDGVCATATGECTLRAAIQEANALDGADTINVPAGTYTVSIAGKDEDAAAMGDLDITDDLTIIGASATNTIIDGNKLDRVFHVIGSVTVDVRSLKVQNGEAMFIGSTDEIKNLLLSSGGGLFNDQGNVLIVESIISGNTARTMDKHQGGHGGGIRSHGQMTIVRSTISDNIAYRPGGGAGGFGGGIESGGGENILTVIDSTIFNNSANGPDGEGGGIFNSDGKVFVINSTIARNTADSYGGGITNDGGYVTTINSTITENFSNLGGGVFPVGGGVMLQNTILAGNNANGCPDCYGSTLTSLGNNLIGDTTCCDITLQPSDLTGDPGLGAFTDDGTPGNGHFPLLATSQAIDAGTNDVFQDYPDTKADQLGNPRADGNGDGSVVCDIGAVEHPGIVNDLVTFNRIRASYETTTDTTGCGDGFVGQFSFDATLRNKSNSPSPLSGLVVEVAELTNGNVLQNADEGPGGVGSRLTVPCVDGYDDCILEPGESVKVHFIICLTENKSVRFVVDVLGFNAEEQTDQEVASFDSSQVKKQFTEPKSRITSKRFFGRFRP